MGDSWGTYASAPKSAYQALMRSSTRDSFFNAQVPFMWEDTRRRLASIPHGGNYRDLPEDLQRRYLNGQKWGPETGRDDLSRKHFSAYRRLHPDFPSWTLNTKADCVYHYDGSRALSVREFARLSSFPDHFEFLGPDKHTRYRLVGNAVPPLLTAAVGRQIVALLETKVVSRPKRTKVAGLERACYYQSPWPLDAVHQTADAVARALDEGPRSVGVEAVQRFLRDAERHCGRREAEALRVRLGIAPSEY